MPLLRFIILLALFTTVLKGYGQSVTSSGTAVPSCLQKANHLLDEAFTFIQKNYYRKNSVEWDTLIASAKKKLSS